MRLGLHPNLRFPRLNSTRRAVSLFRVSLRRHPLGFNQYNFEAGRFVVSLHVWKAGSADPSIHDHRFTLWSWILWGRLREQTYVLTEGTSHVIMDVPSGGAPRNETARPVGLRLSNINNRKVGQIYKCQAGDVHEVTYHPRLTLVFKWLPAGESFSHVIIPRSETR